MQVLFTGASSFTGFWFIKSLFDAGHRITAIFRKARGAYADVRGERVEQLEKWVEPVYNCSFGDKKFMALIRKKNFDLLCHHAAEVNNYKHPDFDVINALKNNTQNLKQIVFDLVERGCLNFLLTGSVFEGGEGAGSDGLPHVSPYGLSKALTFELVRYYADKAGMSLGKFVISNPFGPYEEPRFTHYLIKAWYTGVVPCVRTPLYVRDNIHVDLLAKSYVCFAEGLLNQEGFIKTNPGGYVESQGAFAKRFAQEMGRRLNIECRLELDNQTAFPEPHIRINTDPIIDSDLGFDENKAWDCLAAYYNERFC